MDARRGLDDGGVEDGGFVVSDFGGEDLTARLVEFFLLLEQSSELLLDEVECSPLHGEVVVEGDLGLASKLLVVLGDFVDELLVELRLHARDTLLLEELGQGHHTRMRNKRHTILPSY